VSNIERKDIGIILNVTPSISPDGFVRMEVSPEISQVSQRTTQITQDFLAPIIQQRKVTTTVTVKDGQTVVIGGLMQSLADHRQTKVPFLGDIPVVGWLFRTKQDQEQKTQLLVILTPKVIYNDDPEAPVRESHILNQKIDGTQSPSTIRDAMQKNHFFEQGPDDPVDPFEAPVEVPATVPPPVEVSPPPPRSSGHGDTYVPPKRNPKP
jgi:general secretion pathway protein D